MEPGVPGQRLQLLRDRAWLVSDAAVIAALEGHPVLPVRDIVLRRGARLVAFVLGIMASPSDDASSIALLDIPVDAEALSTRLAMPRREVEEVLRALWVSGVLVPSTSGSAVRFARDIVPPSGLAVHVRWPVVLERLTAPPREGTQAALMLFRIMLERLHHPADRVPLPRTDAADLLGLSGDQVRRGVRALIETGLWEGERSPGRRGRYALGRDVLVGVPPRNVETNPPAPIERPVEVATEVEPPTDRVDEETSLDGDLVLQVGERRIVVPESIKEIRLPDSAIRASVEVDPVSKEVRIVLR